MLFFQDIEVQIKINTEYTLYKLLLLLHNNFVFYYVWIKKPYSFYNLIQFYDE